MGLTQRQVDTTAIEAMLRTMLLQLDSIKEVLVSQWIDFFNVSSVHALASMLVDSKCHRRYRPHGINTVDEKQL